MVEIRDSNPHSPDCKKKKEREILDEENEVCECESTPLLMFGQTPFKHQTDRIDHLHHVYFET